MGVVRGFVIVLASGAILAAAGGGIGYTLGCAAPSYYRAVFSRGDAPGFDPIEVGVGLGLTQGLLTGLAVGSLVMLGASLSRRPGAAKGGAPDDELDRRRSRVRSIGVLLWIVGPLLLLPAGLLVGWFGAGFSGKLSRFSEERRLIEAALSGDPAWSGVEAEMFTGDGTAYLVGRVKTADDRERLRVMMLRLFGETRVEDLVRAVSPGLPEPK